MGVHPMKTEKSGLYSRENYLFDFSIDICFHSHFLTSTDMTQVSFSFF
jgi:hypothetical protein